MNTISLVGRSTKDIEVRTTTTGKTVASFCIAVDRRSNNTTDFIDCVAWGKVADILVKYVKKGDRFGVIGSLQTRSYEDKNGNKRKAVEVLVDQVELLGAQSETRPESDQSQPVAPAQEGTTGELPFEI